MPSPALPVSAGPASELVDEGSIVVDVGSSIFEEDSVVVDGGSLLFDEDSDWQTVDGTRQKRSLGTFEFLRVLD